MSAAALETSDMSATALETSDMSATTLEPSTGMAAAHMAALCERRRCRRQCNRKTDRT
jgi:hypothetical protein